MTIAIIIKKVIKLVRKKRRGGVIIDTRKDIIMVMEERALDDGQIVVIGTDGKKEFFTPSRFSILPKWIKNIMKLRKK